MIDQATFLLNRVRVLSIVGAFVAHAADYTALSGIVPEITSESIETLLKVMSASMLVIATFSVASMVSAYASASSTATPRAFAVIVADDVSQNALSAFVGAFIFSIVSLVALQNGYYGTAGLFTLFVLTLLVFAIVIVTFVGWVDSIARLGRLGNTIDKVEAATRESLQRRIQAPHLGGAPPPRPRPSRAQPVYTTAVGYVRRVDLVALQTFAEQSRSRIEIAALPGTFTAPGRVLAYLTVDSGDGEGLDVSAINEAFRVGDSRTFDEDPRFGLVVLSEIASRALSPGVNDPGTAIDVIGTLVRLFSHWAPPVTEPAAKRAAPAVKFERVAVPAIALEDMFDDAFNAMARDGAGTIEVVIRLQKAFESLASIDHPEMPAVAAVHARRALQRAELALELQVDLEAARSCARAAGADSR